MASIRIEVAKMSVHALPDNIEGLINKLCEIRDSIPVEYRELAEVEFDCSDFSSDFAVSYYRDKTEAEIRAEAALAAHNRAARIEALKVQIALLQSQEAA